MSFGAGLSSNRRSSNHRKGVTWMLLSAISFVSVGAVIKYTSKTIHPFEIGLFRNLFAFLILLPFVAKHKALVSTTKLRLHFYRGLAGLGATLSFFYALSVSPIAEVMAINALTPLFVVLYAFFALSERPSRVALICLSLALLGALLITRPGFASVSIGNYVSIVMAVMNAVIIVIVRKMTATESSISIAYWMSVFVGLLCVPFAIYVWVTPTVHDIIVLVGIAIGSIFAQFSLAEALRFGNVNALMPVDFFRFVWAAALGLLLFGEPLNGFVLFGSAIIIGANIMISATAKRD